MKMRNQSLEHRKDSSVVILHLSCQYTGQLLLLVILLALKGSSALMKILLKFSLYDIQMIPLGRFCHEVAFKDRKDKHGMESIAGVQESNRLTFIVTIASSEQDRLCHLCLIYMLFRRIDIDHVIRVERFIVVVRRIFLTP
jgi:hypothetical protein